MGFALFQTGEHNDSEGIWIYLCNETVWGQRGGRLGEQVNK